MEFMKKTLNSITIKENNLYNIIYDLFFYAKIKESEDDVKNGRVITVKELRDYIDELETDYANKDIE